MCFQCLLTPPAAAAFPNGKSEQENLQNLSDHTEMRSKCSGSSTSFSFSFNPTNAVLIRVGSFHFFQHKLAPCQTQLLPFSRFLVLFCICLLPYARLCFTGARSVACFALFFPCCDDSPCLALRRIAMLCDVCCPTLPCLVSCCLTLLRSTLL